MNAMARVKYERIVAVDCKDKDNSELWKIIATYLEGVPHIKYKGWGKHYLILADIGCISKIVGKLRCATISFNCNMQNYYHYSSENGYCYFYNNLDHNTISVRSKNLKILWD